MIDKYRASLFAVTFWTILWLSIAVMGICTYCDHLRDKKCRLQQSEERLSRLREDKRVVNAAFVDLVDMVHRRDTAVYGHVLEEDRKMLARFDDLLETSAMTEEQKTLANKIRGRIERDMRRCKMLQGRLEQARECGRDSALDIDFEMFIVGCEFCER